MMSALVLCMSARMAASVLSSAGALAAAAGAGLVEVWACREPTTKHATTRLTRVRRIADLQVVKGCPKVAGRGTGWRGMRIDWPSCGGSGRPYSGDPLAHPGMEDACL